jgi:hypothetical protein
MTTERRDSSQIANGMGLIVEDIGSMRTVRRADPADERPIDIFTLTFFNMDKIKDRLGSTFKKFRESTAELKKLKKPRSGSRRRTGLERRLAYIRDELRNPNPDPNVDDRLIGEKMALEAYLK